MQKLNAYVAPMMLCVNRPQESQEMPRPRHHDMHSCQVLGPEGEGPFAGALEQVEVVWRLYEISYARRLDAGVKNHENSTKNLPEI